MIRFGPALFCLAALQPCSAHAEDISELVRQTANSNVPVTAKVSGWLERDVLAKVPARGGIFATLSVARTMAPPADMCKRIKIELVLREIPTKNNGPLVDWLQPYEVAWCPEHFTAPLFVRRQVAI